MINDLGKHIQESGGNEFLMIFDWRIDELWHKAGGIFLKGTCLGCEFPEASGVIYVEGNTEELTAKFTPEIGKLFILVYRGCLPQTKGDDGNSYWPILCSMSKQGSSKQWSHIKPLVIGRNC